MKYINELRPTCSLFRNLSLSLRFNFVLSKVLFYHHSDSNSIHSMFYSACIKMSIFFSSNIFIFGTAVFIHRNLFSVSEKVIAFPQRRSPTAQEKLYENVLKNYSKSSRPVNDPNKALNLSFNFELTKIYDVVSQTFLIRACG